MLYHEEDPSPRLGEYKVINIKRGIQTESGRESLSTVLNSTISSKRTVLLAKQSFNKKDKFVNNKVSKKQ